MANNKITLSLVIAILAVALIASTAIAGAAAEAANKRKPSEIKVYVTNIGVIKHKLVLKVCLVDDDDCFGKVKTIDLQKYSGEKRVAVATYQVTFSPNPDDEFSPTDIGVCGKLNGNPTNGDSSACTNLVKVKSKHWKAVLSYKELLNTQ
jgi:hypothetical protein